MDTSLEERIFNLFAITHVASISKLLFTADDAATVMLDGANRRQSVAVYISTYRDAMIIFATTLGRVLFQVADFFSHDTYYIS